MLKENFETMVVEYDVSIEFSEFKNYWCDSVHHFFYDGHLLGTNPHWIDRMLRECEYVPIYRYLIRTIKDRLSYGDMTDENRKYLEERLHDNQVSLFNELSNMIQQYCI